MEGRELQLSDLPEPILLDILSKLPAKEVVRSSVLYTEWRYLWKSVPVSLSFCTPNFSSEKEISNFVASVNKELYYWRLCEKVQTLDIHMRASAAGYVKDVNTWVHFATQVGNVEEFKLDCLGDYEFPQFAYNNTSLRNLVLRLCWLNPSGSVNWSNLISLSIICFAMTDGDMEKVIFGCPNMESLEIYHTWGFHRLQINSVKLRELIIRDYHVCETHVFSPEIYAPNLQSMQLIGFFPEIHLKNVTSLVTAVLDLSFNSEDDEDRVEVELIKVMELLYSVAHVENLELSPWCIKHLSILELKGWQFPRSSRKFLKLDSALEQLDLLGVYSFLQSSLDLETLLIDWYNDEVPDLLLWYTSEVEQSRRFETHNFNGSLPHLKTIKIINLNGPQIRNKSVLSLIKYLLKNAVVLEKLIIAAEYVSQDDIKTAEEFLNLPRSSLHASLVLSYQ